MKLHEMFNGDVKENKEADVKPTYLQDEILERLKASGGSVYTGNARLVKDGVTAILAINGQRRFAIFPDGTYKASKKFIDFQRDGWELEIANFESVEEAKGKSPKSDIRVDNAGNKKWYKDGELHREDGPAIEFADGDRWWYKNGKQHRDDGPAVEQVNSTKGWYINGKLHREDGPAIEYENGDQYWYINGKLHREDGPAVERADGSKEWYLNGVKQEPNVSEEREVRTGVEEAKGKSPKSDIRVDKDGNKRWYVNGVLHREDGPAIELAVGSKFWFINGKRHREDGPAIELANGDRHWYKNGKRHRDDGPAIEYAEGDRHWYINGERHKEDGPAAEQANGSKFWFVHGKKHREDGPAIELADGEKQWFINDKKHREDGPAVIQKAGSKFWYINGVKQERNVSEEIVPYTKNGDTDQGEYIDDETGQIYDQNEIETVHGKNREKQHHAINNSNRSEDDYVAEPEVTPKNPLAVSMFGDIAAGGGDPIDHLMTSHNMTMDQVDALAREQGYTDAYEWAESFIEMESILRNAGIQKS